MSTAFGERHPWLGATGKFIISRPFMVVSVAAVVAFLAAPGAIFFMPATTSSVDPPNDSTSWHAREKMRYYFPTIGNRAEFAVVVALKDTYEPDPDDSGSSLLDRFFEHPADGAGCSFGEVGCVHRGWRQGKFPPMLGEFKGALKATKATMKKRSRRNATTSVAPILELPGLVDFSFALRESLNKLHHIVDFTSNATLWYEDGVPAPRSLVSPDGRATIMFFRLKERPIGEAAKDFYVDGKEIFEDKVRKYLPESEVRAVIYAGAAVANTALRDVEKTFLMMDVTSLPIALGVLLYVLQSPRLFLFPMVLMSLSLTISYGIMYMVSLCTEIMATTPTLMMNLIIAMSVDYSLFFLTRFKAEYQKRMAEDGDMKRKYEEAIIVTLETAGFAIFISGSTLCISFFVLCFMPSPTIQTLGIGCTVALVFMVSLALTVAPAVMLLAANFVEPGLRPNGVEAESSFWKGVWTRLVRFQSNPVRGGITVLLVTAATLAIGWPWYDIRITATFSTCVPINSDAFKAAEIVRKEFGSGVVEQYRVLMTLKEGKNQNATSVLDQGPWEDSQRLLRTMASNLPYTQGIGIESLSYTLLDDVEQPTPWEIVAGCLSKAVNINNASLDVCRVAEYGVKTFVSDRGKAMYANLALAIDPSSTEGRKFTKRARNLIEKLEPTTAFNVFLAGIGPEQTDTVDKVIDLTPAVMLATMSLAFVLYGVCFHSIAIPLRSVTSIALTMVWCFGLAVRVYQQDMFGWLSWAPLRDQYGSQHYLAPITAFSIVTGLCLDYDIFLLTRVTELRAEGKPTREAIEEGVISTGSIITAAGVIMFATFSGLIYCTTTQVVNILGFYMSTAVLFDTFVIRATIVPATMFMLDRYEWWPSELSRKMPCDEEPS